MMDAFPEDILAGEESDGEERREGGEAEDGGKGNSRSGSRTSAPSFKPPDFTLNSKLWDRQGALWEYIVSIRLYCCFLY
jgi:hypothetical protein